MAKPRIIHDEQIALARKLLADGMGICDVARRLNVNRRTIARYLQRPKQSKENLWRPEEIALARRLRNEGHTYLVIAKQLGRSEGAIERKLFRRGTSLISQIRRTEAQAVVPDDVAAERERAYAYDQDPCVALMGDPRPGRSALERRNG